MKLSTIAPPPQAQPVIIAVENDDDGDINVVATVGGQQIRLGYFSDVDGSFRTRVTSISEAAVLTSAGFRLNERQIRIS